MDSSTVWLIVGGLGVSILGGIAAAIVVVRLPKDYFTRSDPKKRSGKGVGPLLLKIGKNLLGVLLMIAGVVLLFPGIPGPGVVILMLGLVITDIPGKRKLMKAIARRPSVMKSMNRVRRRFGRPNLAAP